jgi:Zn-dependent metalloprotease
VRFDRHVTEAAGRKFFAVLDEESKTAPAFALERSEAEILSSETVARRILDVSLASERLEEFTTPDAVRATTDFVSLGVETVALTGTKFVKFRQTVNRIPVYGSLVSIELDKNYKPVSLDANFAAPAACERLARKSPRDAVEAIAARAGYKGRELPAVTPSLCYYPSRAGRWHLAYMVEQVRVRPGSGSSDYDVALAFDYVVDATSGKLVAELPRTVTFSEMREAPDLRGEIRRFAVDVGNSGAVLRDRDLNLETYDGRYKDPRAEGARLPEGPWREPWSPAAVSAHANAAVVAQYLREVLNRNGIDNRGGRIVSIVNCVACNDAQRGRVWENACWDGTRMLYGQLRRDGELHSYAANVDIVAHELFHGLIGATARLEYEGEPGALNESYCDIFAILISNWKKGRRSREHWDWKLGEDIYKNCDAQRNFSAPGEHGQFENMSAYKRWNDRKDKGGVHYNSGIHNFAAYSVMTARHQGRSLFRAKDLAAMFYVALTQHLSRQATFLESRRAVLLATRSYFRKLPPAELAIRIKAVEDGFAAAGIV